MRYKGSLCRGAAPIRKHGEAQSSFFRVIERDRFDPALVLRVLRGEALAVVFRGHTSTGECEQLVTRFLTHEATRRRDGDATGLYLGAFHWRRERDEYLKESRSQRRALDEVLGTHGSWHEFLRLFAAQLAIDGQVLRPARWAEAAASSPLVRAWQGSGEYSLVPHDDLAQCLDPAQAGFEAQHVATRAVCSVNLCIANDGGGELVLWDYAPTQTDRARFGTEGTGGPYPTEALAAVPCVQVSIAPGDLYVFNGGFIHAVASAAGRRATVSTLIGYASDDTVVMWT